MGFRVKKGSVLLGFGRSVCAVALSLFLVVGLTGCDDDDNVPRDHPQVQEIVSIVQTQIQQLSQVIGMLQALLQNPDLSPAARAQIEAALRKLQDIVQKLTQALELLNRHGLTCGTARDTLRKVNDVLRDGTETIGNLNDLINLGRGIPGLNNLAGGAGGMSRNTQVDLADAVDSIIEVILSNEKLVAMLDESDVELLVETSAAAHRFCGYRYNLCSPSEAERLVRAIQGR